MMHFPIVLLFLCQNTEITLVTGAGYRRKGSNKVLAVDEIFVQGHNERKTSIFKFKHEKDVTLLIVSHKNRYNQSKLMFADEYYDTNVTSLFLKITVFDEYSKKLVSLVSLKLMVFL